MRPSKENIQGIVALDTLKKYFNELDECLGIASQGESLDQMVIMDRIFGFSISRSASTVSGTGVFVSSGWIRKGSLVALYPGMFK